MTAVDEGELVVGRSSGDGRRHRVPARGAERPATQQPTHRQPQATGRAVGGEGVDGVLAAGGGEPAGRRPPFHCSLIARDQANQPGRRRRRAIRSNSSSTNDRVAASGRAPIRNSPGGNVPADDAACRMARRRRRTRLRTTAGPSARPRANATRGGVELPGGSRMYVHQRTPARARCPSAARRVKARRSRMCQIKPTDGDGPWRDATSARRDRPGCSSGGGNRASWHGGGCWVGRCASRSPPRAARGSVPVDKDVRNGATPQRRHARTGVKTTVARGPVATEGSGWPCRSSRSAPKSLRSAIPSDFASVAASSRDGCPHDVDNDVDFR